MALQTFGELIFPALQFVAADNTTFQLNATGEKATLVCQVPKTGNADKFAARIQAVANAPDNGLRFSFQDVSLADGQPDGTADQSATVSSGSVTTGWLDPGAFGAARAVTRGDFLALVIDIPTFTAGDDVIVGGTLSDDTRVFPYGIAATASKQSAGRVPQVALHYDDGTWAYLPLVAPGSSAPTALVIDSGTTPDEVGLAFTLPYPAKISGAYVYLLAGTGCDYDLVLYDAGGTALATKSVDGNFQATSAVTGLSKVLFASDVTLSAGALYRLIVKPTTTTGDLTLSYVEIPNTDVLDGAWDGGDAAYMTVRTDAGAWTNYNNGTDGYRRVSVYAVLTAFDDSAGGAGASEVSHVFVG